MITYIIKLSSRHKAPSQCRYMMYIMHDKSAVKGKLQHNITNANNSKRPIITKKHRTRDSTVGMKLLSVQGHMKRHTRIQEPTLCIHKLNLSQLQSIT